MAENYENRVRIAVDVVAGVLPGTPEDEYTRQFFITSKDWYEEDANQAQLLSDLNGKAMSWANYLMLQPDRFNWIKLEWIYF